MDSLTVILVMIILPLNWLLLTLAIMFFIRSEAKKKWNKNEANFPYFHYPFYKKIFLLGLKGAVDLFTVIVTFIFNIVTAIFVIVCALELIYPNIVIEYLIRITAGIYGVSMITKSICHWARAPKF